MRTAHCTQALDEYCLQNMHKLSASCCNEGAAAPSGMVFDVIIVNINVHGRRSRMTRCIFLYAARPYGWARRGSGPPLKLKALI